VHRIEGEALRRFATLEDAIASLPGFRVRRQGGLGGYSELSFRGARASRIEIHIDGMRLNQDGDPAPDLAKWPLLWFTSLEARTGIDPGGAGPGTLARIDLSTHGSGHAEAHARGGAHATLETAVTARGHGAWRWSAGVQGQHSRNDYPFRSDNGTVHNTGDDGIVRMENNGYWSRGFRASALAGDESGFQSFSLLRLESRKEYPGLLGTGSSAYTNREDWMGAWRMQRHGAAMLWEAGAPARAAAQVRPAGRWSPVVPRPPVHDVRRSPRMPRRTREIDPSVASATRPRSALRSFFHCATARALDRRARAHRLPQFAAPLPPA
jgi:hypothetical protein